MAGFLHQNPIARRKRVDQCRLPGAGAGSRKDDHRLAGAKDPLKTLEQAQGQRAESRTAVIDGRLRNGPQNALGNIGRAWDLEKMAACLTHARSLTDGPMSRQSAPAGGGIKPACRRVGLPSREYLGYGAALFCPQPLASLALCP